MKYAVPPTPTEKGYGSLGGGNVKTLIFGSTGQLGSELVKTFQQIGQVIGYGHADLDVTDTDAVYRAMQSHQPDVVMNTTAFMNADRCEGAPNQAYLLNAVVPGVVSRLAAECGAISVWFSSDFVFDGTKTTPYVESDATGPLNTYGLSKVAGEMEVARHNPRHYIIRTASLYGGAGLGGRGGNFVETMLARAKRGEALRIVDDVIMSPTYAVDLAGMVLHMMDEPYGTYHVAGFGHTSWYAFCKSFLDRVGLAATLAPMRLADQPGAVAPRPKYSALESSRLSSAALQYNRPWQEALYAYLVAQRHVTASVTY